MVKNSHTNGLGIPTQGSNGVPMYLYKGSADIGNTKIKDDMKAAGSEETVLNMEETGTNNELYLKECYLLKNVIFVKIR